MDPLRPLQTKPSSSTSAASCAGFVHHPTLVGFGIAAVALFTLALVAIAGLLLMRRVLLARGAAESYASSTAEQGSSGLESSNKIVAVSQDVSMQISGATLVLLAGEEAARTLAVPMPALPLQLPGFHPHPQVLISLQLGPAVSHAAQPPLEI